ncbi:unnamed protein product [Heligmosomoides polygyrus]|uniref:Importin N-terminal domain-containing protein n=1 Tax=Heligmosomoides polygyrus TaxID=6339 RepID=A0A183F4T1_HELPZ|nr:unnamed protein product [Heligmosomoides polygyrus]
MKQPAFHWKQSHTLNLIAELNTFGLPSHVSIAISKLLICEDVVSVWEPRGNSAKAQFKKLKDCFFRVKKQLQNTKAGSGNFVSSTLREAHANPRRARQLKVKMMKILTECEEDELYEGI